MYVSIVCTSSVHAATFYLTSLVVYRIMSSISHCRYIHVYPCLYNDKTIMNKEEGTNVNSIVATVVQSQNQAR